MDWYEDDVQHLERRVGESPISGDAVAFYGSSSIRMWDSLPQDFPNLPVINMGFGGSTLAACAHFFTRIVLPCQPMRLVIYAGDNDLGDGRSPNDVLASFRELQTQILNHLPETKTILMAIKPSPLRWSLRKLIHQTNQFLEQEVDLVSHFYFADTYSIMLDKHGDPQTELFQADGLHLSAAGYRVWAAKMHTEFQRHGFI